MANKKRTDKLLYEAMKSRGLFGKQVSIGFVDIVEAGEHTGEWRARADLWDGNGHMKDEDRIISYHATKEEAVSEIERLAEAHIPNAKYKSASTKDIPIIIDTMGSLDTISC